MQQILVFINYFKFDCDWLASTKIICSCSKFFCSWLGSIIYAVKSGLAGVSTDFCNCKILVFAKITNFGYCNWLIYAENTGLCSNNLTYSIMIGFKMQFLRIQLSRVTCRGLHSSWKLQFLLESATTVWPSLLYIVKILGAC